MGLRILTESLQIVVSVICSENMAKNHLKCCQIATILIFYMKSMLLRKTAIWDSGQEVEILSFLHTYNQKNGQLECGPMPNVMAALRNIGGALCSMPQSLAERKKEK